MKKCSKCKILKEEAEFSRRSDAPHRLQSHCKPCKRATNRESNERNPGAAKKAYLKWLFKNPERAAEMYRRNARKWRAKNLEKARRRVKKWQQENREAGRIYAREYRRLNPEKTREANRKWRAENLDWLRESFKEWAAKNPMKLENNRLRKYGLTIKKWKRLLAKQGGACCICHETSKPGKPRLAIDHDHKTGKVRGLLCSRCNTALGLLRDSAEIVQAAANYLRHHDRAGKPPEFDRTD